MARYLGNHLTKSVASNPQSPAKLIQQVLSKEYNPLCQCNTCIFLLWSWVKIGEDKLHGHLAFYKKVSLAIFLRPINTNVPEFCWEHESVCKCDTCAFWSWHCIYVKPAWAQLVWISYLSLCFVRKLTSCEFEAEWSIWPQLSRDDSLAERELTGTAALLCRQMLRASPRLSGDHHCFLWAPLCLVLWSVPLITACLPAFFPTSCQSTH